MNPSVVKFHQVSLGSFLPCPAGDMGQSFGVYSRLFIDILRGFLFLVDTIDLFFVPFFPLSYLLLLSLSLHHSAYYIVKLIYSFSVCKT